MSYKESLEGLLGRYSVLLLLSDASEKGPCQAHRLSSGPPYCGRSPCSTGHCAPRHRGQTDLVFPVKESYRLSWFYGDLEGIPEAALR